MKPTHISLTLVAFFRLTVGAASQACYYPDGSEDPGHFACSSGGTSVCCAEGFQCLSNGLCNDPRYENYGRLLRGGCTDSVWGDGCPQMCISIWPQGDEAVYKCSNEKFCCGKSKDCCNDSAAEAYTFRNPQVIAIAGESVATQSDLSRSTTRTASLPDSRITTSTVVNSGSGPTATNVTNDHITTPSRNIIPIAIGVGVGGGILIILLALAGCWYIRRRRREQSLRPRNIFEIAEPKTPTVVGGNSLDASGPEGSRWRNTFGRAKGTVFELRGDTKEVELPARHVAYEVHGDSLRSSGDIRIHEQ